MAVATAAISPPRERDRERRAQSATRTETEREEKRASRTLARRSRRVRFVRSAESLPCRRRAREPPVYILHTLARDLIISIPFRARPFVFFRSYTLYNNCWCRGFVLLCIAFVRIYGRSFFSRGKAGFGNNLYRDI